MHIAVLIHHPKYGKYTIKSSSIDESPKRMMWKPPTTFSTSNTSPISSTCRELCTVWREFGVGGVEGAPSPPNKRSPYLAGSTIDYIFESPYDTDSCDDSNYLEHPISTTRLPGINFMMYHYQTGGIVEASDVSEVAGEGGVGGQIGGAGGGVVP
ncbi:hypothetical protein FB451DRAFT_1185684 [Mycena latifolia]|nr:hypothetical protein FB451DRAFT_1185684 [Mycena latifolia]